MKRNLLIPALLFVALSSCTNPQNFSSPNIVLILIDDMGWKDVGYAGSSFYDTPNIDKLASEGMYFTNAYSPAPVCTPSRGGIFSGKFPGRTKLTTVFNGPAGPDDRLHEQSKYRGENDQYLEARHRHALPKSEVIIAQALADYPNWSIKRVYQFLVLCIMNEDYIKDYALQQCAYVIG